MNGPKDVKAFVLCVLLLAGIIGAANHFEISSPAQQTHADLRALRQ